MIFLIVKKEFLTKVVILGLMVSLFFPFFSLAQKSNMTVVPNTLEEGKSQGEKIAKGLPQGLKKAWQEALNFWEKIFNLFIEFWQKTIQPKIKPSFDWIFNTLGSFFQRQIEKRPNLKEEFKKEMQEMKESIKNDLPNAIKYIREKL